MGASPPIPARVPGRLSCQRDEAVKPLRRQCAARNRLTYGTAGFMGVSAISEAAGGCELLDVGEGDDGPAVLPQAQFAHSERVDDHRAARQREERADRRGVPSAGIILPDAAHELPRHSEQGIDLRGLVGPRAFDHSDRLPPAEMCGEAVEAIPRQ